MIKLYGLEVSGNSYKIQLFMAILNIDYEFIELDVKAGEHKTEAFLGLNPRGEFPVLIDDKDIIWDSQAILVYLARKYAAIDWYPKQPTEIAKVTQWLTVANGEIFQSLARARAIVLFSAPGDMPEVQQKGRDLLQWLERHLKGREWIATDHPSIADIACYPYVALCEKGGISLAGYSAIHHWFHNIQRLPGYIEMPELFKVSAP